jgi:lipoate-protein ligase A
VSGEEPARLDASRLRASETAVVVERELPSALVVLGSSLDRRVGRGDVPLEVVRRRGGGGAVLLEPERAIWIDLWLPRALQRSDDARGLLDHAGELFAAALDRLGVGGLDRYDADDGVVREVACFAGLGHGELVDAQRRKLLGLTAWRCREGALVQAVAYRYRGAELAGLLALEPDEERRLVTVLTEQVTDLAALSPALADDEAAASLLSEALADLVGARLERRAAERAPRVAP